MKIRYRNLKRSDYGRIKKIIDDTWDFSDDVDDEKALNHCLNVFLHDYLGWSNYTKVAVANDKVVGFLFGRCDKLSCLKQRFLHFFPYHFSKWALLFNKGGRFGLKIFCITDRVNNQLIQNHTKEFDAELCLFVVAENYAGEGIGSALLTDFHKFLKKNKAKNYFLYTDTYCDVGFYHRKEYDLISLDTVDFGDNEKKLPKYALYGCRLDKVKI